MSCLMDFGEVNIPSSSAYWDCDEDEPTQDNMNKLQLSYEPGQSEDVIASDLLIVIEGLDVVRLVKTILLDNATKVCEIPTETKSWLYSISEKKILLAALEKDMSSSGEITELLLPYVQKTKELVTITITNKIYFKSEDISDVRKESTLLGINSKMENIKELQAPNFITGVAAGLASWRENKSLSASSYVAYTHKGLLDVESVDPIAKLLQKLGIACNTFYNYVDSSTCYS